MANVYVGGYNIQNIWLKDKYLRIITILKILV